MKKSHVKLTFKQRIAKRSNIELVLGAILAVLLTCNIAMADFLESIIF